MGSRQAGVGDPACYWGLVKSGLDLDCLWAEGQLAVGAPDLEQGVAGELGLVGDGDGHDLEQGVDGQYGHDVVQGLTGQAVLHVGVDLR